MSGCLGFDSPSDRGGVQATVVEDTPGEAEVVEFSESPAAANDDIRQVVTEAVQSTDHPRVASTELDGERFEEARAALSELPHHDGEDAGYYVRYENETVRLNVFLEE